MTFEQKLRERLMGTTLSVDQKLVDNVVNIVTTLIKEEKDNLRFGNSSLSERWEAGENEYEKYMKRSSGGVRL